MQYSNPFSSYRYLLIALLLPILMLGGCAQKSVDPLSVGDPQRGAQVFQNGTETISVPCSGCHSLDGSTLDGEFVGPSIQGIAETAGTRTDQSAEEYLRASIINPGAYIVDGYRNSMEQGYQYLLSEEEIDDLVAFMLTQ